MSIEGSLFGILLNGFGRKPNIPSLKGIDPTAIQQETIAANQGSLGAATTLASGVNEANFNESAKNLRRGLDFIAPGQLAKVQGITNSQLAGEIPQDIQDSVLRSGAARSLAGGIGGSQLSRNLTLRDLGLTSLGIQQQGISNFQALASMAPQSQQFNISSMFFTPEQRLSAAFTERGQQFQRNLLSEQVNAAPDPAAAALTKEIDRFFNTVESAAFSMAGGMV